MNDTEKLENMPIDKNAGQIADIGTFFTTEKNKVIGGTLYLVATPIGNLADMSARALKVLSEVDFVAAEDTRNTYKLLSFFGINKPLVSYFEHNKSQRGDYIIERLKKGESCALVTDAGTPAISDPGEDIVRLCAEQSVPVTAVPGCCAAVNALALSALPTGSFAFEGFLHGTDNEKKKKLEALESEKRTLILYEAPHRLKETLNMIYAAFGVRKISLCRELTKINEEIIRTTTDRAIILYEDREPRGEYVLVIEGAPDSIADCFWSNMSADEHVNFYMSLGHPKMEAIKLVAKDRGVGKNKIYKELLENNTED